MAWTKEKQREYNKRYYLRRREELMARAHDAYAAKKDDPAFRQKQKEERELAHFGVLRSVIFRRSKGKCVRCGKKAVIVHHLDGDGRTNESKGLPPGHDPDRLVAMCRSCHMKEHWQELFRIRKANGFRRPSGLKYRRKGSQEPGV